jgi:predicted kinase
MVARHLGVPIFAKDRFQSVLRFHGLAERSTADGYHLMFDLAEEQLSLGVSVILDAVFPLPDFRIKMEQLAYHYNANFSPIYCYCSDENTWKERVTNRTKIVQNWTPADWESVTEIRLYFVGWNPDTTLFIDAVNTLTDNLDSIFVWTNQEKMNSNRLK